VKHKQEYFDQAVAWSSDAQNLNARSRRTAWIVAGIAVGIAAFEAVALAMLAPLKTVQPITLLVDRHTGFVQALDPESPRRVAADEALTNSYLAQYVMAREGFDRATIPADYRKVALWSAGAARSTYLGQMPATNPNSPFNQYPTGAELRTRVKSVSRLADGTAMVRFDTQLENGNGQVGPVQAWLSVIRYRYVDAPTSMEERLINPLGFQVLSYRRDAEIAQPVGAPPLAREAAPVSAAVPAPGPAVPAGQGGRYIPANQMPMGSPLGPDTIINGAGQ